MKPHFLCLLALAMAGCNDNWAHQTATAPPLLLGVSETRTLLQSASAESDVGRALTTLGDPSAIHAVINRADPRAASLAQRALSQAGIDPARIQIVNNPTDALVLRAYTLAPLDCANAVLKSWFGNASNSLYALGMCVRAAALGQEIANPGDLVQPAHLQAANGARFGRVVQLWEAGQDRDQQSDKSSSNSGPFGSGGGGGGASGTSAPSEDTTAASTQSGATTETGAPEAAPAGAGAPSNE
ncbi:hypothetical protein [Kozakia baliensis]|uniref:hypothetical protein n=1 Tax=Kozakia baliensis TaxID=153496 RepID=UPI0008792CFE|nr:hypothetical protein [Kozakia baliensis]AOX19995.1 hypothetical protein A0U90_06505 [Kozakia baliensis]